MDRAFVDARPAFIRQGTDAAGVAQVFFLEGNDAEVAYTPVGAGIHIAGPYLHLRVQCDSKGLSPAFAVHGAKGFDKWMRIKSDRAREGGLTAAFSPGNRQLADTPVYENSRVGILTLQFLELVDQIGKPAVDYQTGAGFRSETGGSVSAQGASREPVRRRLIDFFSAIWTGIFVHM
jgi:hypothetical protein